MPEDELEDLPGVGPATADKLVDNGFESYQSIAVASPGEMSNTADIGESSASDIINAAREAADVGGFETGATVLERRQEIGKLSWQIDEVDDLLGGGIETQSITEVYGEFGSGKSQVTHQMAVNVQLSKENGGLEGGCIFVDSEDTFRPERIDDMVRGLDDEILADEMERREIEGTPNDEEALEDLVDAFLDQIHVAKAFNSNHQILLAEKAKELAGEHEETEWPIRIVCVDSLTAHFRAEYVGRGELAERQQKLNKHLHDLMRLGDLYNTAILVTNQVASNPDSYFGDPTQAIGGNILGHASTFRIYLRKSKGDKRIVRLVDAPNLADGEAVMRVQNEGLKPE
ncbi:MULTISPECIES: DNA repair and recombination protein RadA [Halorubrum]|uniref:DNA repair and recombination protein RadA n=61 Tax=Halorubrum TaxID=56688 RepID=M0EDX2_9EURY|nr:MULTISPECIES: DNA repair and recombination protein RadA [Halorubrum distributum group]ELZ31569.1 DNA repair and recombination protein RadA [Halorubrum terrestre JCM 10247]ELZ45072.1 DNA repair and recombination protein RadA [Halorubrum distributum JCM 9100]ELZ51316.1 DNA repair and recombination protein RadA [Halorubrum distributum JCM 10118]EMA60543.1 DNA repair and recombination protein RadA [Halorubrum litoreum JCM 13561]EMA70484.1 DNA repair and recombination protein RadA [Halorubrum ar